MVIGGAPCQGFSKAGTPGRTFTEDPRNYLFKEFVRIVDCLKPSAFVFENVAALVSHNKGKTILEIIHSFEEIGYNVVYQIMNTSDYSIPQERRRLIMVGTLNTLNLEFNFPSKEKKKITVADAISDLPPLQSGQTSNIPNHVAMKHSKQMLEKMSYVSDGGDRSQIPEPIRPKSGDLRKYIRYASTKPSICITGDMRKVFHYNQNRALTARELARLQSFPDDFIFIGNSISIQQQIGNAVPPILAYKIAKQIEVMLNGKVSNCKFYRK